MTTAKEKPKNLAEEERKMDKEIERLEAERLELEAPARALSWDEIQAGEDLEKRERRRGILPRLIVAAKVKRLELRRERYERETEPLRAQRREAHARLEEAKTKRLDAIDEENKALYEYSDAFQRVQGQEKRLKAVDRELAELRGEG